MPVIDNVVLSDEEKDEIKERCVDLILNCESKDSDYANQKIAQLITRIGEFIWGAFELGQNQNIPR